jgi:Fur family transcriptional regulator, iron response regulator
MTRDEISIALLIHGLQVTPQRVMVAEVLLPRPTHMTADEIKAALRRAGARVSQATLYKTLNLFVEAGLIRQLSIEADRAVYDSNTQPHHHLYDSQSQTLYDVDHIDVEFSRMPMLPEGLRLDSIEVIFRLRPSGGVVGAALPDAEMIRTA